MAVNSGAFEMGRVVRISLGNEEEARGFVMSIEVAVLETATANDAVRAALPNLLGLGRINFDITAVAQGYGVLIDTEQAAVGISPQVNDSLEGIGEDESVLQTAR